jgi:hypothetical protein
MPLEDKRTRRLVEREISKHAIDSTLLRVLCINEIIYLDGVVREIQGPARRGVDLQREMSKIVEAIEGMKGVRDVVEDYRLG